MSKLLQHAGLLALAALAFNGVWQLAAADVEPAKGRQQWEWMLMNETLARKLDPVDGWELVAVSDRILYFKRPK